MDTTHLRRSLAALATTLTCLAASAAPASATVYNATITGGVLHVYKASAIQETITLGTAGTCPQAPTIQADLTATTAAVTAFSLRSIENFGHPHDPFLVVVTRLSSSPGSYASTSSPHTITSSRLTINAALYPTSTTGFSTYDPTTCLPLTGATPTCNLAAVLHLTGTTTSSSVSHTYSLDVTTIGSIVANPACTSGWGSYLGGTLVTSSSITGHFTS